MKINIMDTPDRYGYWWAYEDLDECDAGWMLVFVENDVAHYGMVIFELSHFKMWVKANFSEELKELYEYKQ